MSTDQKLGAVLLCAAGINVFTMWIWRLFWADVDPREKWTRHWLLAGLTTSFRFEHIKFVIFTLVLALTGVAFLLS